MGRKKPHVQIFYGLEICKRRQYIAVIYIWTVVCLTLFFCIDPLQFTGLKWVEKNHTYKFFMALRFAKEDNISPSTPLKDILLQNIRQFSLTIAFLLSGYPGQFLRYLSSQIHDILDKIVSNRAFKLLWLSNF
jgi:hypothetical protein